MDACSTLTAMFAAIGVAFRGEMPSHCGSNLFSLMANKVNRLLVVLLSIPVFLLKCLFAFAHLSN